MTAVLVGGELSCVGCKFGISRMADIAQPTIKYAAIPDRFETFDVESKEAVRGRADKAVHKGDAVRLAVGDEFL